MLEAVLDWQNRPLEEFYPAIYFDAISVKVRDFGHVRSMARISPSESIWTFIKHALGN